MSAPATLSFATPPWLAAVEAAASPQPELEGRMAVAIEAARRNVEARTGGPFGAAVFERDSGRLVALGVNLVVPAGLSILHAEMVAIARAQRCCGVFDLGAPGLPAHELVTSAEPCAMCFGAIPWSGVRRVVSGARSADAEAIGFDEGPRHPDWVAELERRGIAVVRDVMRAQAVAVLERYAEQNGDIYNSRGGG